MIRLAAIACFFCVLLSARAGEVPSVSTTAVSLKDPKRAELEALGGFEPLPAFPPPATDFNIRYTLLVVAVPDAEALKLIPRLRDSEQIESASAALQTMVGEKRARLVGWPDLCTKTANRTVMEMHVEARYPTDDIGCGIGMAFNAAPVPAHLPTQPRKNPLWFWTRNAGISIELEPNLDLNDMSIEAQIAIQHTRVAGIERLAAGPGQPVRFELPRFHYYKITSWFTLTSGEPLFLGSFPSLDHPGETDLLIIQATAELMTKQASLAK